ncbi:MAG: 50S ribosomal protein L23 [Chromatiaceae bacterium]|jgi:large subunit ribosomal protein L23|nr:50S ribosomal protein L23 [Candidatus Thioaporhodococcus sediminis]
MNQERLLKVLLSPVISEKATLAAENNGQYAFRVVPDANKYEVGKAVEALFDVKVEQVQILNVKGKKKRFGQRFGRRKDWRKAYVRLATGQSIDFGGNA